jgi:hypothetical protein
MGAVGLEAGVADGVMLCVAEDEAGVSVTLLQPNAIWYSPVAPLNPPTRNSYMPGSKAALRCERVNCGQFELSSRCATVVPSDEKIKNSVSYMDEHPSKSTVMDDDKRNRKL